MLSAQGRGSLWALWRSCAAVRDHTFVLGLATLHERVKTVDLGVMIGSWEMWACYRPHAG